MKATELLKKQHREVKALFKQIEDTDDAEERRAAMETIAEKLGVHMTIEEEIFYPAVRAGGTKKAAMALGPLHGPARPSSSRLRTRQ